MPGGFNHYEQSLRVVDVLERDGRGPEPHVGDPRRDREALEGQARLAGRDRRRTRRGDARGADRPPLRPDRLRQPRHRRRHPGRPADRRRPPGAPGGGARPHVVAANRPAGRGRHRTARSRAGWRRSGLSRTRARRDARTARVPLRAGLRERAGRRRSSRRRPASSAGSGRRCTSGPTSSSTPRRWRRRGSTRPPATSWPGMTDRYAVALFERLFIPKPWAEAPRPWEDRTV